MPKVSVIIPVYNVEKYLRECLDSVVNQTLKDIEIICVNDGSTDNSLKILEEYALQDNRIKIINQENQGAGAARNNGMNSTQGEYLLFLDSDDFFDLRMFETLYDKMLQTKADIIGFGYYTYDEKTKNCKPNEHSIRKKLIPHNSMTFSYKDCPFTILNIISNSPWNKIYKTDFLRATNLHFQNLSAFNDVYFATSVLGYAEKIVCIDKPLLYHRVSLNTSITSSKTKKFDDLVQAVNAVINEMQKLEYYDDIKVAVLSFAINAYKYFYYDVLVTEEDRKKIFDKLHIIFNQGIFQDNTTADKIYERYLKREYEKFKNNEYHNNKYKEILHKLFSLKNTDIYKQITLFGRQYKFISKKLINKVTEYKINDLKAEINRLKESQNELNELTKAVNYATKPDSILLVEPNDCHGEVIPGYVKYFKDLGFNVDIVITPQQNAKHSLFMFDDTDTNIFILSRKSIKEFLSSKKIEQYKYIVFTSHIMYAWLNQIIFPTIFQHFPVLENYRDKLFVVEHHFESADKQLLENKHIIMLTKLPSQNGNVICANPHYFGDITITSKNPVITEFIMVGAIEAKRRNCNILIDAVNQLVESGFDNFRITVIGRGSMDAIPEKLRKYFNILGYVPYDIMYKEMEKADFFLPLIDPDNPEHDRYITVGTSGSFQLIYGFQKPCLIAEKFTELHYFNNENSIIYQTNSDLADSMKKAILMPQQDYLKKQESLKSLAEDLYKKSLDNLEKYFYGANDERNS